MDDVLVHHPLKREVDMFLLVLFWYVTLVVLVSALKDLYILRVSAWFTAVKVGSLIGVIVRNGLLAVFLVLVYGHIPSL